MENIRALEVFFNDEKVEQIKNEKPKKTKQQKQQEKSNFWDNQFKEVGDN